MSEDIPALVSLEDASTGSVITDLDEEAILKLAYPPNRRYLFLPTGDSRDIAIAVVGRPNIIHRIFQRLFFGFRYIRAE
jgi:hypothetical protein